MNIYFAEQDKTLMTIPENQETQQKQQKPHSVSHWDQLGGRYWWGRAQLFPLGVKKFNMATAWSSKAWWSHDSC